MGEIVDLITEDMETQGNIEFAIEDQDFFNPELKEYTVFYKIVGESRIKLFRNNRMELVFVRLNDDWMRQAKLDITGAASPLEVRLKWDNGSVDELFVRKPGQDEFQRTASIQIDN